ncbi:cell cycle checkpoint protein RAD1-like [Neocloeon triangulifer]|uniref:cell cycle checkpoint protein RAD1-like n=1 Tax=Neocloeon triangulifer TaxID=2078957 RepID=UPI00286F3275|nr:cell cycle checkpoint protein RAD1-like [Neocloeon triangulifer]
MPSIDEDVEDSEYQLVFRMDNVKNIYHLLKAINFHPKATCFATESGLRVSVESGKCSQANAFIQSEIFQEYQYDKEEESVNFSLDLSVLLECLDIFGDATSSSSSTALKLRYKGHGNPVQLLLEEEDVLTDCSIRTMEVDELSNFEFTSDNVINKIILRSEPLKEILNSVDPSTDSIELVLLSSEPVVKIKTLGYMGECEIVFNKESDMIELFQCESDSSSKYKFAHFKPALKALNISQKVSIRTDDRGLLCMQFMIKNDDGHICFIEFYSLPVSEEDD